MPTSILWIAALSGLLVLGGAHLALWLFLRAHRGTEGTSDDETGGGV